MMAMQRDLLRLGVRSVGRNRRRSLFAGAMVMFAVGAVVFFKGYTTGIRNMMVAAATESMIGSLQIQHAGYAEAQDLAPLDLDLPQSLGEKAQSAPGVKAIAPRLRFTGMLASTNGTATVVGLGMDPARERDVCPRGMGARAGGGFNALTSGEGLGGDDDGLVLAADLARGLGVKAGDPITLEVHSREGAVDVVDTVVRGVFRLDDPQTNKLLVLVPLGLAQRLLGMEGRVTAFAVALHDPDALGSSARALASALAPYAPDATVHTWSELAPYLHDVIDLQDDVFTVVLVVVIILVIAGVANTVMMTVQERRREIGTLMAIGFGRRAIVTLFLVEAAWLAFLAATVGAAIGITLVRVLAHTGIGFSIPSGSTIMVFPDIALGHVGMAVGAAMLGAVVAAALPAYRASRLQPIEVLRSI